MNWRENNAHRQARDNGEAPRRFRPTLASLAHLSRRSPDQMTFRWTKPEINPKNVPLRPHSFGRFASPITLPDLPSCIRHPRQGRRPPPLAFAFPERIYLTAARCGTAITKHPSGDRQDLHIIKILETLMQTAQVAPVEAGIPSPIEQF